MSNRADDLRLRVDYLPRHALGGRGTVGLTLCPGRTDRHRSLGDDLDAIVTAGSRRLVCLITDAELEWAGVLDLPRAAAARDLVFHRLPIIDQGVPPLQPLLELVQWLVGAIDGGEDVTVHCMGGLGRSGLVAACVLVAKGSTPEAAIRCVRNARSPRAIETTPQEQMVQSFAHAWPSFTASNPSQ